MELAFAGKQAQRYVKDVVRLYKEWLRMHVEISNIQQGILKFEVVLLFSVTNVKQVEFAS